MKNVIITGGAGFLGSHLAEKLMSLKYKVTVIDDLSNGKITNLSKIIKKIKFIKADISKTGNWQKSFKNADYVYHLAALADIVPSINNPKKYFDANVTGTINVLEASKKYKVKKIIYSASSSCYGIPKKYPTNENEKIDLQYPYSLTKKLGEDLVLHFSKVYKINVVSLRFFNIYGLRARTSGNYGAMFGVFLAQKINNLPFTVVGDGNQKRDFIYVSDAVLALLKSLKVKEKNIILNIGSGKCVSINYICKLLSGKKIHIPKRPGEPDITWANITKAKATLKWRPKVNIQDGVRILLENIELWKNAPTWNKSKIHLATKDWFKFLK